MAAFRLEQPDPNPEPEREPGASPWRERSLASNTYPSFQAYRHGSPYSSLSRGWDGAAATGGAMRDEGPP
jgi:hypothetical protein